MRRGTRRLVRRFSLGSLAVTAFATFALASAPTAAAQETLAASCEPEGANVKPADSDPVAQNFTATASGNLTRAAVSLAKTAGTTEPFTVQIWTADINGDPVTLLATGTIDADNVPDGASAAATELVGVVFDTAAPIVAGQQYAIVVQREGGQYVLSTSSSDCPGQLREFNSGTKVWDKVGNADLVFRVFVTPPGAAALTCRGERATIVGTDGSDEIVGTTGRDVIAALGGNDQVKALAGNDLVCGGAGKDSLRGGKNKDKLYGQKGKDKLSGGGGKDRCVGGKKDDSAKKCEVEKSI